MQRLVFWLRIISFLRRSALFPTRSETEMGKRRYFRKYLFLQSLERWKAIIFWGRIPISSSRKLALEGAALSSLHICMVFRCPWVKTLKTAYAKDLEKPHYKLLPVIFSASAHQHICAQPFKDSPAAFLMCLLDQSILYQVHKNALCSSEKWISKYERGGLLKSSLWQWQRQPTTGKNPLQSVSELLLLSPEAPSC